MYGEVPFAAKTAYNARAVPLAAPTQLQTTPARLVLLCGLGEFSAQASIELSRSGWAIADSSTLLSAREHAPATFNHSELPCVGLVMVGSDPAATRRVLEALDDILPTRFLWLALLSPEAKADAKPTLRPHNAAPVEEVRALIAEYCFDFFTLPVNWDYLANTLGHALGMLSLAHAQNSFEHLFVDRGIIGESEPMQALVHGIRKVAQHDQPVMIIGELGAGKTMAARAVHNRSLRAAAPFVVFNCANYSEDAVAQALFGSNGAPGAAQGGTLLLANLHDLPTDGQQHLLRILDEKVYAAGAPRKVDVRIMSACTRAEIAHMAAEQLNHDLYHRLNVLSLHVPALRERTGDLHLLARYFLNRYSGESNRRLRGFTKDAQTALTHYRWPGNVRELISRVRRAIVMCEGRSITAHDLGLENITPQEHILTLEQARNQADVAAITTALTRHRNRLSHAARDLGISRVTLYRLLERYQIKVRGAKLVGPVATENAK
jgi:DNA-binding NtrC family response regulator